MQKSDKDSDEPQESAENEASDPVEEVGEAGSASLPSDIADPDLVVDPNSTTAVLSEDRWEEMFQKLLNFKVCKMYRMHLIFYIDDP
jgi:hypothetical protein